MVIISTLDHVRIGCTRPNYHRYLLDVPLSFSEREVLPPPVEQRKGIRFGGSEVSLHDLTVVQIWFDEFRIDPNRYRADRTSDQARRMGKAELDS